MSGWSAFWESEENQKKYGFEYENHSIYYDGDIDELLEAAYKWAGFTPVENASDVNDTRPLLELAISESGSLMMKGTGAEIEADVDGQGDKPNFFIRFTSNGEEVLIRFKMLTPELYPDIDAYPYRFSLKSLSSINDLYRNRCEAFASKWKLFHPGDEIDLSRLPNYRAILSDHKKNNC